MDAINLDITLLIKSYVSDDSEDFDGNMMIVYFLLGVAGVLFIVWIILTIVRIKYS